MNTTELTTATATAAATTSTTNVVTNAGNATSVDTTAARERTTGPSRSITRRPWRRLAVVVAALVGALAGVGMVGTPASAAANQWWYYDLYANNGRYEIAIWYDGYGRPTQIYADLNANGRWDTYSQIRNGYPVGWLLNTYTEFDNTWDVLIASNGQRWSNTRNCATGATGGLIGGGYYSSGTQVRYNDTVYGMTWCYQSSLLTGLITAPIHESMLTTLTRLGSIAPSQYCYTYPTAVGCYARNW